jgi:hypothetical protein
VSGREERKDDFGFRIWDFGFELLEGRLVMRRAIALAAAGLMVAAMGGCGLMTGGSIADRAACSSLCKLKAPTDEAFKTIADMGYKWVDLSALTWAPHVSVKDQASGGRAEGNGPAGFQSHVRFVGGVRRAVV